MTDQPNSPATTQEPGVTSETEVKCPLCKHKFLHKIAHVAKWTAASVKSEAVKAGDDVNHAIEEAKSGE